VIHRTFKVEGRVHQKDRFVKQEHRQDPNKDIVKLTQLRSDLAASDLSSGKPSVNQVELSGSIAPDTKSKVK
jgi:hypothetical protein